MRLLGSPRSPAAATGCSGPSGPRPARVVTRRIREDVIDGQRAVRPASRPGSAPPCLAAAYAPAAAISASVGADGKASRTFEGGPQPGQRLGPGTCAADRATRRVGSTEAGVVVSTSKMPGFGAAADGRCDPERTRRPAIQKLADGARECNAAEHEGGCQSLGNRRDDHAYGGRFPYPPLSQLGPAPVQGVVLPPRSRLRLAT